MAMVSMNIMMISMAVLGAVLFLQVNKSNVLQTLFWQLFSVSGVRSSLDSSEHCACPLCPTLHVWPSDYSSFTCLAICLFLLYMFGHLRSQMASVYSSSTCLAICLKQKTNQSQTKIFCPRFAFGAGASPLLWVFMGEIIPADYKVRIERVGIRMKSWKNLIAKFFSFR